MVHKMSDPSELCLQTAVELECVCLGVDKASAILSGYPFCVVYHASRRLISRKSLNDFIKSNSKVIYNGLLLFRVNIPRRAKRGP